MIHRAASYRCRSCSITPGKRAQACVEIADAATRFSGGNVESRKNTFATMTPRSCDADVLGREIAERAQEQEPAKQQHQRDRDLRRHQQPPQAGAVVSGRAAFAADDRSSGRRIAGARPNTSAVTQCRLAP